MRCLNGKTVRAGTEIDIQCFNRRVLDPLARVAHAESGQTRVGKQAGVRGCVARVVNVDRVLYALTVDD